MDLVQVRPNVYMIVGAGGNTTIQFGDEGVMVVDTQFPQVSAKLLAAIKSVTDAPIRYVVSTTCMAITSAAMRRSPRPAARAPAATWSATSAPRQRPRPASSRTRTC